MSYLESKFPCPKHMQAMTMVNNIQNFSSEEEASVLPRKVAVTPSNKNKEHEKEEEEDGHLLKDLLMANDIQYLVKEMNEV